MAEQKLLLTILTPEGTDISDVSTDEVIVPAENGMLGIKPGHAPLVAMLKAGTMKYNEAGNEKTFDIFKGFAEVFDDKVLVLAVGAELADEMELEAGIQAERKKKNNGVVKGDDLNLDEADSMIKRSIEVLNNLRKNAKSRGSR
jgi:F-type H+-transporting ATPase subunit epsilon